MAGWRFGVWSIGPILGNNPSVVGFEDDVLFVIEAGVWVGRPARCLVGAQFDVAE